MSCHFKKSYLCYMKKVLSIFVVILFVCGSCKAKKSNKAAEKMRRFIIEIAQYARQTNPKFIVIPQNGTELIWNNQETNDGFSLPYSSTISGIGQESIFYEEKAETDYTNRDLCKLASTILPVLSSDWAPNNRSDAFALNAQFGFVPFPRVDYDYAQIPEEIPFNVNASNILTLSEAKNYLYIIGANFDSKQTMVSRIQATNYDVIIMDLFFEDEEFTAAEIESLKTKANGGSRLVISYMNIGAAEKYRYYYKKGWVRHVPRFLKRKYKGYKDEIWVEFWDKRWKKIIYRNDDSYTKKILKANFDGVYLDNVEAYYFLYYRDK
jgi:cysteinyl-tRNA synthetase, unknown class